ncbi:hypothetical protein DOT_5906 [Desulfosporosinus sp. OT]|nr:hypothetical protein DOT_5906 [Desulfosporosinus sp. OT]
MTPYRLGHGLGWLAGFCNSNQIHSLITVFFTYGCLGNLI